MSALSSSSSHAGQQKQVDLSKSDLGKVPSPDDVLNFILSQPTRLMQWTIVRTLIESLIGFVIAFSVCSGYILLDTVTGRAQLDAFLFFIIFAVGQEHFYILPSTALAELAVDAWRMKDRSLVKQGLLFISCMMRVAGLFLGAFATLYVLKSWYGDDTVKTKLAPMLWQDNGTLSRTAIFFVYALAHLMFNGLLFYFYYRTNVPNYVPKGSKWLFREEYAAVYRLLLPLVMACSYYQIIILFSSEIGDPIQFHIYLVLQALFGMHHATGLVVGGCIAGSALAMIVPLFINTQYNTKDTVGTTTGREYNILSSYDLNSRRPVN